MKDLDPLDVHIKELRDRTFMRKVIGLESARDSISDVMLLQALMKYRDAQNLYQTIEALEKEILTIPINNMDTMLLITKHFSDIAAIKIILEFREKA